jgi:hypothetical protein
MCAHPDRSCHRAQRPIAVRATLGELAKRDEFGLSL